MTKAVPVVSVSTVMKRNPQPGCGTSASPPGAEVFSRKNEIPSDCTIEDHDRPVLVHCVIFLRPRSPSLDSFSRYGQTTVSNCRMIEAEM